MHFRDRHRPTTGQSHPQGPRLTDHVQAGRDQPILRNDEARAHAFLVPVTSKLGDDHD
jgi:hypothetical protein